MTNAQKKVNYDKMNSEYSWCFRRFRKKCVEQGIVEFVKDFNFYEMKYRGHFVCYLRGKNQDSLNLMVVWNAIQTAEETIKNICGEEHDCK